MFTYLIRLQTYTIYADTNTLRWKGILFCLPSLQTSVFDLFIYFPVLLLLSNEMTVIVCWTRIKLATDEMSVCEWFSRSFSILLSSSITLDDPIYIIYILKITLSNFSILLPKIHTRTRFHCQPIPNHTC